MSITADVTYDLRRQSQWVALGRCPLFKPDELDRSQRF